MMVLGVLKMVDLIDSAPSRDRDGYPNIAFCQDSLNQNASSIDPITETEVDHKQHGVSLLNPTQKIIEEAHKIHTFPVDLHDKDMESSKETEDDYRHENGGSISNANKISEKSQANTRTRTDVHISSKAAANLAASSQKIQTEECNTTTVPGKKLIQERRYSPRRSTRREKRRSKRLKRD
ncbi:hypothetical protein L6452_36428 [Arctium lappa]|uniref:Uncharacterized protein n=1 Tax=Arctium lappa TaxID=4217 RepID=A0ACB8Y979_ARCLA|nr:hypothetical protein L6452_36428 [Arctium lappa]